MEQELLSLTQAVDIKIQPPSSARKSPGVHLVRAEIDNKKREPLSTVHVLAGIRHSAEHSTVMS